ncbi:glycosyltransferase [Neobacillus muris]|uniref:glycosyltransferase n=1 Tax=Neobacillus muris TaxID=2941334 RepID=UPI00203EAED8|nr:glycosyltransferase [Neobacillus muris]
MKPFISLCMIVKNEDKVLGRCLSSVAHLVDEVIVVDTGSTDRTKEIAAKYTTGIYDFEWINDFSAARNFAADKASGEWILVLDADEYIDEDNFKDFVQEIKDDQNQFDAYTVKILNFTGNFGESLVQNAHDRVYKNNGEIQYIRKIHEQFHHRQGKPLNIKLSSLQVFHSGYLNQVVNEKDKGSRNIDLLEDEKSFGSSAAFDHFNYGNEYASKGDYSKALESYLEAYKGKGDFRLNWVSTTLVQIIVCLMQLKRYNDALNVIGDAERIYTNSAEIQFLRGEIFFLRGQMDDAKQVFHQIIDHQDKYNHIILRPDLKDQKPHLRLAEIYLYEEDYKNAIHHYSSVININKHNHEAIKKMISILNKFHTAEEIANFITTKELVNSINIQDYVKASFDIGEPHLALKLLEGFEENHPLLYKIGQLKNGCMNKALNMEEIDEILNVSVMKDLVKANWINILDVFLLREMNKKNRKVAELMVDFEQEKVFKDFAAMLTENTFNEELDENLFIFALQTLIQYRRIDLCKDLLNEKMQYLNKKSISKVAALLYVNGLKADALQIYEKSDWNYFNEQDFINIINSLLETNNVVNAVEIAKYALAIYEQDFRFYKLIVENTKDRNLYTETLQKARMFFVESPYLKQLI